MCGECGELLGSFSELHTGLSGPNKIPVALLSAMDEDASRAADIRNAWFNAIIIGALAAMLIIGLTVGLNQDLSDSGVSVASAGSLKSAKPNSGQTTPVREEQRVQANLLSGSFAAIEPINFSKAPAQQPASFRDVRTQIRSSDAYQYSDEIPGFLPIRGAFDCCLEWLQDSFFGESNDLLDVAE